MPTYTVTFLDRRGKQVGQTKTFTARDTLGARAKALEGAPVEAIDYELSETARHSIKEPPTTALFTVYSADFYFPAGKGPKDGEAFKKAVREVTEAWSDYGDLHVAHAKPGHYTVQGPADTENYTDAEFVDATRPYSND